MRDTAFRPGEVPAEYDSILRRFEQAWQGPGRPDLEGFLPAGRPASVRLLVELVHVELDFRLRRGEAARVEDYLARFPDLAADRPALLGLIAAERALRTCWEAAPPAAEY